MKRIKWIGLVFVLATTLSCSSDDEDVNYNFIGQWELTKVTIISSSENENFSSFQTDYLPNEDCLQNQSLNINAINATVSYTSAINVSVNYNTVSNEPEHQIDCIDQDFEEIYGWTTGDYVQTNSDGSTTTSNGGDNTLRLFDSDGVLKFSAFMDQPNTLRVGPQEAIYETVEIDGEEVVFSKLQFLTYTKQL